MQGISGSMLCFIVQICNVIQTKLNGIYWTLEHWRTKPYPGFWGVFFPLSDIGIFFFNNCAVLRPWFLFFKHYIHIDKFCVIFEFFFLELNCNKINNSSWQTSLMQLLNWLSNYTTLIPVLPHMNYEFLEYLMCW